MVAKISSYARLQTPSLFLNNEKSQINVKWRISEFEEIKRTSSGALIVTIANQQIPSESREKGSHCDYNPFQG
jgi:hypothetical protein